MTQEIKRRLNVPIDTAQLVEVRNFIRQAMLESGGLDAEADRIILAVDEAVSNVILHAYENAGKGEIDIVIAIDYEKVVVEITDRGRPFDASHFKPPDIKEHVRKGRRNGLGMFIMQQIMDEVQYAFNEHGSNQLRMVKYHKKSAEVGHERA